jgi:nitrite reductase/ring-hydroxylating ferredoxin subunit
MALRVRVCRTSDLVPGALQAFAVRGVTWPVIVTFVDGAIVAVPGVCPHEDVSLADGSLEDGTLTCHGHGYGFDLRTGRCTHDASLELRRYPVTIIDDEIWQRRSSPAGARSVAGTSCPEKRAAPACYSSVSRSESAPV